MTECAVCGTIHGIVTRIVDGEEVLLCVHHERGEVPESERRPVVEYPDKR